MMTLRTGDENGRTYWVDDGASDTEIPSMPVSGGIESLYEKLHARMSQNRQKKGRDEK